MTDYVKSLDFDGDTFDQMKVDMNFVLQRLLNNMLEKGSDEGTMTIKINVMIVRNNIPGGDNETKHINKPIFEHKVTSVVKINDEKSGKYDSKMELVMNEDGVYELRPIQGQAQMSIFDADFNVDDDQDTEQIGKIEKKERKLLPFSGDDTDDE